MDQLTMIKNILAAILLLGEVEFECDDENNANIANGKIVDHSKLCIIMICCANFLSLELRRKGDFF